MYLLKAANVAAEYLSARMGLDHDLPLLLRFRGKIQPALHRFAPATSNILRQEFRSGNERNCVVTNLQKVTVPLKVQPHQLVDIEAEADVGDSAAGVGLTGERSRMYRYSACTWMCK